MRLIYLVFCKVLTLIRFPSARLIRFPIWIRGKRYIDFGTGFTTGRACRIEVFNFHNDSPLVRFGKNVQLNDYVHVGACKEIIIGDNVLVASRVSILDHNHGNYSGSDSHSRPESFPQNRKIVCASITIEDNVWLGENVVVLPGVNIGRGSIIGASSVVSKNIPPKCIAVGNPAIVVKKFNDEAGAWVKC